MDRNFFENIFPSLSEISHWECKRKYFHITQIYELEIWGKQFITENLLTTNLIVNSISLNIRTVESSTCTFKITDLHQ